MEEKIPTAEEFLKSKGHNLYRDGSLKDGLWTNDIIDDMIEFTKLHIQEYQRWLYEESKHGDEEHQQWLKDKIYSYPLENIK